MTPLLLALGMLGCYLLALRGLRMARAAPDLGSMQLDDGRSPEDLGERRSLVAGVYAALGRWTGPAVEQLGGPRWRGHVSGLLAAGGYPRGYTPTTFAQFQGSYLVLAVLAVLLGLVDIGVLYGGALALMLAAYPEVWLFSEAQRRQRQIERELPDFLDILAVTVTAGLSFRQALDRVGETITGPLAEEIRRTLRRMDVGVQRRTAFVELRDRNPRSATMGLFVTAILQAEELGAPLSDTLNQLARDMRREFSQTARRRAARAAPRVSLIITMIVLPGIVALIVTALVIGSDVSLGGF
jgi:tight adherence protein C